MLLNKTDKANSLGAPTLKPIFDKLVDGIIPYIQNKKRFTVYQQYFMDMLIFYIKHDFNAKKYGYRHYNHFIGMVKLGYEDPDYMNLGIKKFEPGYISVRDIYDIIIQGIFDRLDAINIEKQSKK